MHALSLMPDDVNKFGSRSRLVIIAAQRAQQLMKGIPSTIVSKHTKPTTIALEEVLNDKVKFVIGKQAREALKDAKKQRALDLARLTLDRVGPADAIEIKKDLGVVVDDSPKPAPAAEGEW
jgi:DNA-directed RNA polymerase subunit omega